MTSPIWFQHECNYYYLMTAQGPRKIFSSIYFFKINIQDALKPWQVFNMKEQYFFQQAHSLHSCSWLDVLAHHTKAYKQLKTGVKCRFVSAACSKIWAGRFTHSDALVTKSWGQEILELLLQETNLELHEASQILPPWDHKGNLTDYLLNAQNELQHFQIK